MQAERSNIGWSFWLKWVLASIVGWIVGFMLSALAISAVVTAAGGDPEMAFNQNDSPIFVVALMVLFAMGGVGLGAMQWLILRRQVDRAGWWILASGAGFAVIAPLYIALMGVVSEVVNELVHNTVAGAVAGLLQYLILRRQVGRAGLWIAASSAGMVVAGGGAAIVRLITGMEEETSSLVGIAAMVAFTGAVLVWLLRQSHSSSVEGTATAH